MNRKVLSMGENGPYGRDVSLRRPDALDLEALAHVKWLCDNQVNVQIADIGCGVNLWFAKEASKLGATVHAIDRIPLEVGDSVVPGNVVVHCETLPEEATRLGQLPQFDLMYSQRMFHYIHPDQHAAMWQYIRESLKPDGQLFISVSGMDSELGQGYPDRWIPLSERFAKLSESIADRHSIYAPVCLFRKTEFEVALKSNGFEVQNVTQSAFGNIKAVAKNQYVLKQIQTVRPLPIIGAEYGSAKMVREYLAKAGDEGDAYRRTLINPVIRRVLAKKPGSLISFDMEYQSELLDSAQKNADEGCKRVLDIGCGTGYRAFYFGMEYASYLGIDSVRAFVDVARNKLEKSECNFVANFVHKTAQSLNGSWVAQNLGGTPDLLLMIVVAEYFDDQELGHFLRLCFDDISSLTTEFLIVTCNPSFYGVCANSETVLHETYIQSIGSKVKVFLRGAERFRTLLVPTGWSVQAHAQLQIEKALRENMPTMVSDGLDLMQPPFDFWLLSKGDIC